MYNEDYCTHYINSSIKSAYFSYKNSVVASTFKSLGAEKVVDVGSNVNSIIKNTGLRSKLESVNIEYLGLDLDPSFLSADFIKRSSSDKIDLYETPKGIVGNVKDLPFKERSIEAISALDVLEHIDSPLKAITEIHRVLIDNGYVVFIIPSLYKLDTFNLSYVGNLRKSSHLFKMPIRKWREMIEGAGFIFDDKVSRPIGILSGLSYLLWLDRRFIPKRVRGGFEAENHSYLSRSHRDIKNLFAEHDCETDLLFDSELLKNNHFIENLIQNPAILKSAFTNALSNGSRETISNYISLMRQANIPKRNMAVVINEGYDLPSYAIANSSMLVYKKLG